MTSNFLSSPTDSVAVCGVDATSTVAVVAVVLVTPTWWSLLFIFTFNLCLFESSFVNDSLNCMSEIVCVEVHVGEESPPPPPPLLEDDPPPPLT